MDPVDRKCDSMAELKTAVVDAGYRCPSWDEPIDDQDLSGSIWTRECSNGDVLNSDSGRYVDRMTERLKFCSAGVQLNGRNWKFRTARASALAREVGGYVCDGNSSP